MKKLIYLILLLTIVSSCVTSSGLTNISYVDYSRFECFITEATSVNKEYIPKGSVSVTFTGYATPNSFVPNGTKVMNHNEALDHAIDLVVEKTTDMGGNGIINFRYTGIYSAGVLRGWEVTGMAVKFE